MAMELLPDDLWLAVEPLLPPPASSKGGRPRREADGILADRAYGTAREIALAGSSAFL